VKISSVDPRFVEFVPKVLEEGVVYISIPYGTIVHSCCCGCGEKVSTPLSPAQWSLTYDGERISLSPSVGSGALPCRSHYFISLNKVRWAAPLTMTQTSAALDRDRSALAEHLTPPPPEKHRAGWWDQVRGWFRR
jgi:hypothetical protein